MYSQMVWNLKVRKLPAVSHFLSLLVKDLGSIEVSAVCRLPKNPTPVQCSQLLSGLLTDYRVHLALSNFKCSAF